MYSKTYADGNKFADKRMGCQRDNSSFHKSLVMKSCILELLLRNPSLIPIKNHCMIFLDKYIDLNF